MNPFTLVRNALLIFRIVTALIALVLIVLGIGLIAQTYWGPWGWVLGPLALAAVFAAIGGITVGLYSFGEWWKKQERAYNRRRRTAHEQGSHPAA